MPDPGDSMADTVIGANADLRDDKDFWLWQGVDERVAFKAFRLRFGREPGRWWGHADNKTVPEGHLMFEVDSHDRIDTEEAR